MIAFSPLPVYTYDMANKKTTDGKRKRPGRPPTGRAPTMVIFARVAPSLGQALRNHVASIQPKTTIGAVLAMTVERYLTECGLWPPKTKE